MFSPVSADLEPSIKDINVLSRLVDPLILIPLAVLGYLWYSFGIGDGSIAALGTIAVLTCFLGGFALSSWLDSDDNESTQAWSQYSSKVVFNGSFAISIIAVALFLGYAAFVLLPQEDIPAIGRWFLQGLYIVCVGSIVGSMLIAYLKACKGEVSILTQQEETILGESIVGAVQLKLKKSVRIDRVTAKLVGCTRQYRRSGNFGGYTDESVHYEQEVQLPFESGVTSGDQHFAEFQFETQVHAIAELVNSEKEMHWHIQVKLACSGIDLNAREPIDILSLDELENDDDWENDNG